MYHFRSFHLRDMTACGAALRRLGADAKNLDEVADRLVRYLYTSFTTPRTGEPACVLVRLFKTRSYCTLTPDLRTLADKRLGTIPDNPFLPCLTLLASAGAVPGWNDPALSSRYRVIPLGSPEDLEQLPMFSMLIRQLGVSLPDLGEPALNLLLDSQEHAFNVFHILHAEGSPYVPAQEEFVRKYGIRSVLGFGAPLPDSELFSVILFSTDVISVSTAQLFKPLALCAQIALAPYAEMEPLAHTPAPLRAPIDQARAKSSSVTHVPSRIGELEKLLTVHEQTVAAQADRIEMIVSGSEMGTWDWDIPTGQVTWNERWAGMIGYHLDDIEPHIRAWEQLIHPDDKSAVLAAVSAHLRGETPLYSSEYRLRAKSGAWQWVFDSGRVLVRDTGGAPMRAAGIHLDISVRKGLEQALFSANLQLMAILDGATHVSMIATNREGLITTFNRGAEGMLGYSAVEMVGEQSLTRLHVPAEIERRALELTALRGHPVAGVDVLIENARQGGFEEREWTYVRKDGTRLTVFLTVTALRNGEGTVAGFLAMGKDITSRKEAEAALAQAAHELTRKNTELAQARDEALRAAQLKADFLATMSHEIRTPMNAIIGMTGLLLDTALTEDQHEFADTVRRSSDALLTLVNDILDFSKIEAGKLHFEELAFDLRMTIEDTLDLLAEQAQGKGLELIGLVDAAVPTGVHGDPGRLRQILVNLVGNAIKFTSAGEVFLHVTREDNGGPAFLRFTITDTGIGIPHIVQARLFQAFVQADSSTTRRYGGTGLGLVICRRLVAQMQGTIGVESRPGHGSTFWFTARLPDTTVAVAPPAIPWSRLRGRRILLVDQNQTIRRALQLQLAAHGMDCVCVTSSSQAVEMARAAALQKPFDVALIELHGSDMDGFETATLFKQDPATSATRLVILTTIGRRGDGATAHRLGIDAYLTKPLRQTQLLDCLCLLLSTPADGDAPVQADSPPLITRHSLAEARTAGSIRVLLAEDNPVNQKVACKMLEKLGYRVDVAANGQEAVAAHERSPYPLIFMDCQMPEMDGLEATRLIRQREQTCGDTEPTTTEGEGQGPASRPTIHHSAFSTHHSPKRVPIIAMTANAMKGDREECLAAGMDDYVAKPIRQKDLQTVLDTWLHQRNQAAAS